VFDDALNAPQAEAVAHVRGPLLVFAGAGSGKTRVITYRMANLVACARVPPFRILAVTFTNKAAKEMRARLDTLVGTAIAHDLWVGTFHATCARLLRVHGHAIGLGKNFVIYDNADQKAVVNRVLADLDLDDKRYPPKVVLERILKQKQEGVSPDDMPVLSYFDEAIVKAYRAYDAKLRTCNAVDFEDLIFGMVKILIDPKSPEGDKIRRRFEYVLVDEFQDTNATQYRLLRELARDHKNLCVVGDDDQSIYRWRGADIRNIRGFRNDFAGAKVVKLEENYRSTKRIVAAALGVIAQSAQREPKELWTSNADGDPVEIVGVLDEREEAAFVTGVILEERAKGVPPGQIAVFYRIHAQSRVLEEALRAENLPYQIVGGTRFYDRAEIKDALAYLRILVNPQSDVDLVRVINTPARGIGASTLERLFAHSRANRTSLYQMLTQLESLDDIGTGPRKKLLAFRGLLESLDKLSAELVPSDLLQVLLDKTGYRKALTEEGTPEADARLENLAELYGSLKDYEMESEASGETATLGGFLERVSLQSDIDVAPEARILLMTVHAAKGLEFELVLVTGLEEAMFPYRGMDTGEEEQLEEERRLAYVAITRARRRLVLTHTTYRQIFGNTRYGEPSRFLDDIPAGAKRVVGGKKKGQGRVQVPRSIPEGPWRHPQEATQAVATAKKEPGERTVDRGFFDDTPGLTVGSKVLHQRFGAGVVRRVEGAGEPAVVAFFPGWGEKKVLARFLTPG
jgi:DNA helicase-2/ATP-dependent DNA helicase PcrA